MNTKTFFASTPRTLVIASRESRLAMWQATHVQAALREIYPSCDVRIVGMTTRGDQILDRTLSRVGGKGLFVKELETALTDARADLAVHSLKDVPMELPLGFALAAIMAREDPRDAFVSNDHASLAALPAGSVVGTSSLRREAWLRARYPHLDVKPLRGNLDTRLAKLDRGDYAAIILAAAGLIRLDASARIRALIAPQDSLPAAGQGALGIEIRADRADGAALAAWLAPLHHAHTAAAVEAERMVSRLLGGSCEVPLAAYAQWHGDVLRLRGAVALPDASRVLSAQGEARLAGAAWGAAADDAGAVEVQAASGVAGAGAAAGGVASAGAVDASTLDANADADIGIDVDASGAGAVDAVGAVAAGAIDAADADAPDALAYHAADAVASDALAHYGANAAASDTLAHHAANADAPDVLAHYAADAAVSDTLVHHDARAIAAREMGLALGREVAQALIAQGALDIVRALTRAPDSAFPGTLPP